MFSEAALEVAVFVSIVIVVANVVETVVAIELRLYVVSELVECISDG